MPDYFNELAELEWELAQQKCYSANSDTIKNLEFDIAAIYSGSMPYYIRDSKNPEKKPKCIYCQDKKKYKVRHAPGFKYCGSFEDWQNDMRGLGLPDYECDRGEICNYCK